MQIEVIGAIAVSIWHPFLANFAMLPIQRQEGLFGPPHYPYSQRGRTDGAFLRLLIKWIVGHAPKKRTQMEIILYRS